MKDALTWLFARLKEPSTHATLLAGLGIFKITIPPEYLSYSSEILVSLGMLGTALLGIFLPEKKK